MVFKEEKKERENPKEIEGQQALFIVNLEPKEIMGETSEILAWISNFSKTATAWV